MTTLGKLVRTTAFRLSVIYMTVFALFAVCIIAYIAWHTDVLLRQQTDNAVEAEVESLIDHYRTGGIRRLTMAVEARSQRPGSSIYLLTNFAGQILAGELDPVPYAVLDQPGWAEIFYQRDDASGQARPRRAVARVHTFPGGFRLLVGRDIEERELFRAIIGDVTRWSLALVVILGLAGGILVSRRALRRIDAMTETSRTIMAGDLSGRIPVAGTGDELDRLAQSLNAMLERIDELMRGLKEVSDNIAHDLKTPLTRLRNRAEAALMSPASEDGWRAALQQIIEESDQLIRVFDALLMIARAESGEGRAAMSEVDVSAVTEDVAELYEPLAEEKGMALRVSAEPRLLTHGNRELLGQALANLLDNAIKYGAPEGGTPPANRPAVEVAARNGGGGIMLMVADRGPGIPEADRGRVLDRRVRLEASRSRPGSGLGLSLAAAVARLHGGVLTLEDNAPGLRAVIRLPASGAPA